MPDSQLVDPFGRRITYLRLSVTDRCDFRCTYCMSEDMVFAPRAQILTLEELYAVADAFISLGVKRIRVTGGEPLVRKGLTGLLAQLGARSELEDLAITTNGSQLPSLATALRDAGVKRLNISLDSLKRDRFAELTRRDRLDQVLAGIEAARACPVINARSLSARATKCVSESRRGIPWYAAVMPPAARRVTGR